MSSEFMQQSQDLTVYLDCKPCEHVSAWKTVWGVHTSDDHHCQQNGLGSTTLPTHERTLLSDHHTQRHHVPHLSHCLLDRGPALHASRLDRATKVVDEVQSATLEASWTEGIRQDLSGRVQEPDVCLYPVEFPLGPHGGATRNENGCATTGRLGNDLDLVLLRAVYRSNQLHNCQYAP